MLSRHAHDEVFGFSLADPGGGDIQWAFASSSRKFRCRRRVFEPALGHTDDDGLSIERIIQMLVKAGLLVAVKIDVTVNDDEFGQLLRCFVIWNCMSDSVCPAEAIL